MLPRKVQRQDLKTQVKEELLRHIRSMDLTVNRKLPREEQLCTLLGVSRVTLRSVLDDLASEGVIFRRQGKGTFVNPSFAEIKVSFNPVLHFSDMITNSGYKPSTELIYADVEPANKDIASALNISPGDLVLVCAKNFFADDMLCSMTEDYVPLSVVGALDFDVLMKYQDSIFYYIYETAGKKATWDKININTILSNKAPRLHHELSKRGLEPKPYLLLHGVNYDDDNLPLTYTFEYIDTDILRFSQIRKRIVNYDAIDWK